MKFHLDKRFNFALEAIRRLADDGSATAAERQQALEALQAKVVELIDCLKTEEG